LRRVWQFAHKHEAALRAGLKMDRSQTVGFSKEAKDLRREIHTVLKQANYDYERMQYNTVVSALMKMLNTIDEYAGHSLSNIDPHILETLTIENRTIVESVAEGVDAALAECFSILLRVLYPVCPHLAYHLWGELGYAQCCGDLLDVAWAGVDESALVRDEIELMLQVNGKLRGSVLVSAQASKADIEQAAVNNEAFIKQAQGAAPQKIIIVPGRLVNLVL
jgi:leucyl-tRNA synthetase